MVLAAYPSSGFLFVCACIFLCMHTCIYVCNSTFSLTKPDIFYSDLQLKLATRSLWNMAFLSTTSRLMSSRVLDQLVVSLTGNSKMPNYHSLDFAAGAGSRICTGSGGGCYHVPVWSSVSLMNSFRRWQSGKSRVPPSDGGESHDTPALP